MECRLFYNSELPDFKTFKYVAKPNDTNKRDANWIGFDVFCFR